MGDESWDADAVLAFGYLVDTDFYPFFFFLSISFPFPFPTGMARDVVSCAGYKKYKDSFFEHCMVHLIFCWLSGDDVLNPASELYLL
jgi:hypothetical protein